MSKIADLERELEAWVSMKPSPTILNSHDTHLYEIMDQIFEEYTDENRRNKSTVVPKIVHQVVDTPRPRKYQKTTRTQRIASGFMDTSNIIR